MSLLWTINARGINQLSISEDRNNSANINGLLYALVVVSIRLRELGRD